MTGCRDIRQWDWVRLVSLPPGVEHLPETRAVFHRCLGRADLVRDPQDDGLLWLDLPADVAGEQGHSIFVGPELVEVIAQRSEGLDDDLVHEAYNWREEPEALQSHYEQTVREHGENSPEAEEEWEDLQGAIAIRERTRSYDPYNWRPYDT